MFFFKTLLSDMQVSQLFVCLGLASIIAIPSSLGLPKPSVALTQLPSDSTSISSRQSRETAVSTKQTENALIAFNVPNFQPTASFSNGVLQINIPTALLEGPINGVLRANGGRLHDTKYNTLDISNLRVASFRDGGLAVDGDFRAQERECTKVLGKDRCTPWVSVSGKFTQDYDLGVNNRRLNVRATKTTIKGGNGWYAPLVYDAAKIFGADGNATKQVNQQLGTINGMDVVQMLRQYGGPQAASGLGVDANTVNQLIERSANNLNVKISGGQLRISSRLR